MNATDLQNRLARLSPGETLLLPAATIERIFHYCSTREECFEAAATLALWYGCELALKGSGGSQVLFSRLQREISDERIIEPDSTTIQRIGKFLRSVEPR